MYYILVLYTFRFDWRNLRVGAVCADDSQSVLCFLLCRFESCNNILKKKKNLLHHYILWYNWATYVIWGISEPNWCCVEFQFHVKLYWFGFFFCLLPLSYFDLLVLSNISCNLSILKLPFLQKCLKIKVISR